MGLLFKFFIFIFFANGSILIAKDYSKNANSLSYVICDSRLRCYLDKIQQVPAAQSLIQEIQKEGAIRIVIDDHPICKQFGAFWDIDRRTIAIYLDFYRDEGDIIGSIVFELHNAHSSSLYDRLDNLAMEGKIEKEKYVESFEYQEYKNSKSAASISEEGIRKGLFPASARLMTYNSFEEHYHYQKIGGHSQWIGQNYDQLLR